MYTKQDKLGKQEQCWCVFGSKGWWWLCR